MEDRAGEPFIGPSGKLLRQTLRRVGLDPAQVVIMNTVCCYPARTPTDEEVAACHGNLIAQVSALKPRWVLVLGAVALRALGRSDRISAVHGEPWERRLTDGGVRIYFPAYHPSYVLRNRLLTKVWRQDLEHFKELTELVDGRP